MWVWRCWRYLSTDASRDTGELWVGGEGGQVVHSFNERASGSSTLLSVLLVKGSIQSLHMFIIGNFINKTPSVASTHPG